MLTFCQEKNGSYPFANYIRFLKPLKQTTYEIIAANEEIAYNEQLLLLPKGF